MLWNLSVISEIVIKMFRTKAHLTRHSLIHSGIKPFICDFNYCQKKFSLKSNLNKHMKRRLGLKQFICNQNECD